MTTYPRQHEGGLADNIKVEDKMEEKKAVSMQPADLAEPYQMVGKQVEADIRMLAEFHIEDHDEFGKAAQRVLQFIKPIPDAAEDGLSLPMHVQLHGILRAIRTMAHCGEGESILTRISHAMRRLDRATKLTQEEEIARLLREYMQEAHNFQVAGCAEYLARKLATGEPLVR